MPTRLDTRFLSARHRIVASVLAASAAAALAGPGERPLFATAPIHYTVDTGPQDCTVRATGEHLTLATDTVWGFACGSDTTGMTPADLKQIAENHDAMFANPATLRVVDATGVHPFGETGYTPRVGLTINYVMAGSVPAAAIPSFTRAAQYLQGVFTDTYTVTVNVSFAALGSGIIGSTGSNFVRNFSYSTARNALINGQDVDDSIQDFLPTPLPMRRTSAGAITNAVNVDATRANYNVAVGTSSGSSGSMQYNSGFTFDFDPSDGVNAGTLSLTDTVVHETLHAMGFVSRADSPGGGNPYFLDFFRFRSSTENPSTTAEFQGFPRLIAYNDPANDDVVSDVIAGEWRMSDGTPYQASHFFQQSNNPNGALGIMQPALADGVTFYPSFMKASDIAMLDAIGWDVGVPCFPPSISGQPEDVSTCQGSAASFTVNATGTNLAYQWRRNGVNMVSGTAATLSFPSVIVLNSASYDCVIAGDCGTITSDPAVLTVGQGPGFNQLPASQSTCSGGPVTFTVGVFGTPIPSIQWRKDTVDIVGATGLSYTIGTPTTSDAGVYDCVLTNTCGVTTSPPAVLSVGPVCPADYDNSGGVPDAADIDAYFADWLDGATCSDVDGSGGVPDTGDIDAFFTLWLAGGC